jgi:hypothetical protein
MEDVLAVYTRPRDPDDHTARKLIVHTSRTKRSTDFIALLETLDGLYGPRPGLPTKPVVIVLDNGLIHVRRSEREAGHSRLLRADARFDCEPISSCNVLIGAAGEEECRHSRYRGPRRAESGEHGRLALNVG